MFILICVFYFIRIPVIFQGDLAQAAACYLKVNDVIYVTGQLSGDAPPHAIEDGRTNFQVEVSHLYYCISTLNVYEFVWECVSIDDVSIGTIMLPLDN